MRGRQAIIRSELTCFSTKRSKKKGSRRRALRVTLVGDAVFEKVEYVPTSHGDRAKVVWYRLGGASIPDRSIKWVR